MRNSCVVCCKDFIHVHHLKPISSLKKKYVINPETDLRPVCTNCHSIIHLSSKPYSMEEVKGFIKKIEKQNNNNSQNSFIYQYFSRTPTLAP